MAKNSNKKKTNREPVIENRRARHDYQIGDTLEVGIMLLGSEVKSVRDGKVSLAEGYIKIRSQPPRIMLHAVNIAEYPPAGYANHPPVRDRVLLAHKKEILNLAREVEQKGATVIPLRMYFKDGLIKLKIGVGLGKSRADKRHSIAERDAKRDIERAMTRKVQRG